MLTLKLQDPERVPPYFCTLGTFLASTKSWPCLKGRCSVVLKINRLSSLRITQRNFEGTVLME